MCPISIIHTRAGSSGKSSNIINDYYQKSFFKFFDTNLKSQIKTVYGKIDSSEEECRPLSTSLRAQQWLSHLWSEIMLLERRILWECSPGFLLSNVKYSWGLLQSAALAVFLFRQQSIPGTNRCSAALQAGISWFNLPGIVLGGQEVAITLGGGGIPSFVGISTVSTKFICLVTSNKQFCRQLCQ